MNQPQLGSFDSTPDLPLRPSRSAPRPSTAGKLADTPAGRCRYCRCTDAMACLEGCAWFDRENTVCDNPACVSRLAAALLKRTKKASA